MQKIEKWRGGKPMNYAQPRPRPRVKKRKEKKYRSKEKSIKFEKVKKNEKCANAGAK